MVIFLNSIMVMNANRNNYKLDSPSTNKEFYNNSGSNSYHHYNNQQYSQQQQQQPSMNYNSWYSDNSTQHNVTQYEEPQTTGKEDNPSCCNCFFLQSCEGANPCCNDARDHSLPSYNNDNNRSASNVIASYGVYGTTVTNDDDDDDGFVSRTGGGYRYHHSVVVNVTGNATSTNILRDTPSDDDRTCCVSSWCAARRSCCSRQQDDNTTAVPTTSEASCCSNWCRPTILLLLLALLVVVFVLISGILLYFKYMTYKPRPPIIEEPCEKTYCAYGANCVQTPDGHAECQCPSECPTMSTPVCGTDGVTYANHCVMRMKSCRQEKNTRVQYAGECDHRSTKRRHRG